MAKPVKSTDPRKRAIVAELKRHSGCTKITNVKDEGDGWFSGNCHIKRPGSRRFSNTGRHKVKVEFLGDLKLEPIDGN